MESRGRKRESQSVESDSQASRGLYTHGECGHFHSRIHKGQSLLTSLLCHLCLLTCVFSVLVLFKILFHLLINCTWFKMATYTQPQTSYSIQPFSSQNSLGKTSSLFHSANFKKKSNLLLLTPWFVSLRLRCSLCLFSGDPERRLSGHP